LALAFVGKFTRSPAIGERRDIAYQWAALSSGRDTRAVYMLSDIVDGRILTASRHTPAVERRVPEQILVLGSLPAGDVSHKKGGRLPLLSARPAVTPATLKRAATSFSAW